MSESPVALTVGPLELTADRTPDVDWALIDLEGWSESAEMSVPQQRRPTSHGQFFQPGLLGGKVITVNGEVRSKVRAFLTDAEEVIAATLADGGLGTLTVYDEDAGMRWAPVQRLGSASIKPDDEPDVIKFQLQFLAPDAYRYGQTSTATVGFAASSGSGMVFPLFASGVLDFGPLPASGAVSIQNPGSAPAPPVFTITGPSPAGGFVITDIRTGKRNTFLSVVPENQTLTIDASDGSVLLQGVADRSGDFIVEAWPVVPARSVSTFLFEPLSSATPALLTAAVVATYY